MGQQSSTQNQGLDSSYVHQALRMDPTFGEIKIYKKQDTGALVALISKSIKDSEVLHIRSETYSRRKHFNNPNILQVYDFKEQKQSDICSEVSYLQMMIEYVPKNILSYNQLLLENEILYIIYALCDAMQYCKEQKDEINDLHPSKVLLTDTGHIKLVDNILCMTPLSNYMQVKYNDREIEYLAPEEIDQFTTGAKPRLDVDKGNIFCLGLLIIQLLDRYPVSDYYTEEHFNFTLLKKRITHIFEKYCYSDKLFQLLMSFLEQEPKKRPNYRQILATKLINLGASGIGLQGVSRIQQQSNEHSFIVEDNNNNNKQNVYVDDEIERRIQKVMTESNSILSRGEMQSQRYFQKPIPLNNPLESNKNLDQPLSDHRIVQLLQNSESMIMTSQQQSKRM